MEAQGRADRPVRFLPGVSEPHVRTGFPAARLSRRGRRRRRISVGRSGLGRLALEANWAGQQPVGSNVNGIDKIARVAEGGPQARRSPGSSWEYRKVNRREEEARVW